MALRTPHSKQEIEEVSTAALKIMTEWTDIKELKKYLEKNKTKDISEKDIESYIDNFINDKYKLKWSNSLFLSRALPMIERYANIFYNMKMNIIKISSDDFFITSDNPVVHFVPKEKINFYNNCKSLMSPYTEVYAPLTNKMAIVLCRRRDIKEMIMPARKELIEITNYNISINSKDFIFSSRKEKELDKFVENYIPYPVKFTIH